MKNFTKTYKFTTLLAHDWTSLSEEQRGFLKDYALTEELSPDQKEIVNQWPRDHNAEYAINKPAFDVNGRSFHALEAHVDTHPDVERHLNANGFAVKDYHKGLATDKYGRDITIGKALGKSKASPELINTFANDPNRAHGSADVGNMEVMVSHNKSDVAGMTSKGHKWAQESCMNFDTGSNNHYLPKDVEHGTHVAYLIHKNDNEAKTPLARIAIKPFTGTDENGSEHTIFRPEQKGYGESTGHFHHTVSNVMNKLYPPKEGVLYKKNPEVYDDDEVDTHATLGPNGIRGEFDKLKDPKLEFNRNHIVNNIALLSRHVAGDEFNRAISSGGMDGLHPDTKDDLYDKLSTRTILTKSLMNHMVASGDHNGFGARIFVRNNIRRIDNAGLIHSVIGGNLKDENAQTEYVRSIGHHPNPEVQSQLANKVINDPKFHPRTTIGIASHLPSGHITSILNEPVGELHPTIGAHAVGIHAFFRNATFGPEHTDAIEKHLTPETSESLQDNHRIDYRTLLKTLG